MDSFIISFIAGLVGTAFMDLAEFKLARVGYCSGVNAAYIGRWVHGFLKLRFMSEDIEKNESVRVEVQIGLLFHIIIGGAVALLYPLFIGVMGIGALSEHLVMGILFGLMTTVLPWCILMPGLGWGWFGLKTPFDTESIVAPVLSHVAYGLGIGFTYILYEVIVL